MKSVTVKDKVWIPELPRERIMELSLRIRPVVTYGKNGPFYIKSVDLYQVAYTWEPVPVRRAYGLKVLCDMKTYHRFDYCGFFKPTLAEVLAQIPEAYVEKAIAFEIVSQPKTSDDLNTDREALNAGYHVATTRLYGSIS